MTPGESLIKFASEFWLDKPQTISADEVIKAFSFDPDSPLYTQWKEDFATKPRNSNHRRYLGKWFGYTIDYIKDMGFDESDKTLFVTTGDPFPAIQNAFVRKGHPSKKLLFWYLTLVLWCDSRAQNDLFGENRSVNQSEILYWKPDPNVSLLAVLQDIVAPDGTETAATRRGDTSVSDLIEMFQRLDSPATRDAAQQLLRYETEVINDPKDWRRSWNRTQDALLRAKGEYPEEVTPLVNEYLNHLSPSSPR